VLAPEPTLAPTTRRERASDERAPPIGAAR
jgi:hypothetical protein